MAILLALLAAAANATATVFQRLGVEKTTTREGHIRDLMAAVLRQPVWFAGLALTTASFLLQALALSFGTLSTVQPIMVSEIVFLVVILGIGFHRQLGWREWIGSAGTAAGLGTFLAVNSTTPGSERPTRTDWILLAIASGGAVILALLGARHGSRSWRAALYGVAASICFAMTAACIKSSADAWSAGPLHIFAHFEPYGVAVAGAAGLVISQQALNAGPVAASQSALLIINPAASIVMGVWLFGDRLHTSIGHLAAGAVALAVMFVALIVLSSSPLVTSTGSAERLSHEARFDSVAGNGVV